MANIMFNQGLGKFAEWAARVNANDPANSVIEVHAWVVTATDATVKDVDDIAALEATALVTEATNSGYVSKVIDNTGSITVTVDDSGDKTDVDMPDITWTSVSAGSNWTDLSFSYDSDSTAGTDANIVPGTWHDFAVTPDGSDITAQMPVGGFYSAA